MKQVENSMYGKAGKKSIYYTLVYYGLNDLVSSSFLMVIIVPWGYVLLSTWFSISVSCFLRNKLNACLHNPTVWKVESFTGYKSKEFNGRLDLDSIVNTLLVFYILKITRLVQIRVIFIYKCT